MHKPFNTFIDVEVPGKLDNTLIAAAGPTTAGVWLAVCLQDAVSMHALCNPGQRLHRVNVADYSSGIESGDAWQMLGMTSAVQVQ